jgi:hypothetical protein
MQSTTMQAPPRSGGQASDPRGIAATTLRRSVERVFGRWPAWPWSVLVLLAAGGGAGFVVGSALRDAEETPPAALGAAASVGYGLVAAAIVSVLPRLGTLLRLSRGVMRRPSAIGEEWWPLQLLGPALRATPRLRRTQEEFRFAVDSAGGQARSMLADRLWPAWVVAFVAPVLGLITAWQNGARVQVRLQQGEPIASVFPAFIAQVSPPMVAAIGASLVLMVMLVVADQWTKAILRRWCGVVEHGDGEHPVVLALLGQDDFRVREADTPPEPPSVSPDPAPPGKPTGSNRPNHIADPDVLRRLWEQTGSRDM